MLAFELNERLDKIEAKIESLFLRVRELETKQ